MRGIRLPVLGTLLAGVLTAAGVMLWHEAPRLVRSVEAAPAPASVILLPARVVGDTPSRLGVAPAAALPTAPTVPTATPPTAPEVGRLSRHTRRSIPHRSIAN